MASTQDQSPAAGRKRTVANPDEYRELNVFWVPPEARWPGLKAQARQATIGEAIDRAMAAIEQDNQALKDVLLPRLISGELRVTQWGERQHD